MPNKTQRNKICTQLSQYDDFVFQEAPEGGGGVPA